MRSTRSEPLLLRNTMRVTEGHLNEFKQAIDHAVEFVEQHGPQLMVQVFIDDEQLLAHSFQLYPDSAAILRHWSLSDPYIRDVMRHCTVERLEMYGEPDRTIGSARYLGADPAAAAVQDLALFGLWYDAHIGYLRALETVRMAGIDVEDFAPLAATQLGHVVHATADTAREIATSSFPRGPADLTEHAPVLERLTELRRDQSLGDGDLDRIHSLVQQRIELGRGHEGLTSILE